MGIKYLTPDEVRAMMGADVFDPLSDDGVSGHEITREAGRTDGRPATIKDITNELPPAHYAELRQTATRRCLYCGHQVGDVCICMHASPDGCNSGNHPVRRG